MSRTFMIRDKRNDTLVDIEVKSHVRVPGAGDLVSDVSADVNLGLYTRLLLTEAQDRAGFVEHMVFWSEFRGWWFEIYLPCRRKDPAPPTLADAREQIQTYFKDLSDNHPGLGLTLVED